MRLHRALPALLAAALLIAGAAGCGVKVDDSAGGSTPSIELPKGNGATTTTEAKGSGTGGTTGTLPKRPSTTRPGRTTTTTVSGGVPTIPGAGDFDLRSSLIDTYEKIGLDKDQATCLTDAIISTGALDPNNPSAADLDFSKLTDAMVQCNISPSDLGAGN